MSAALTLIRDGDGGMTALEMVLALSVVSAALDDLLVPGNEHAVDTCRSLLDQVAAAIWSQA